MAAIMIEGQAGAQQVREEITGRVAALKAKGVTPCLTVVLVGEDPASQIYVRNKQKTCEELGIKGVTVEMPAETPQDEVLALVKRLNADPGVHGILVQMPLPDGIDSLAVLHAIDPEKDVDGFHPINAGRLASGLEGFAPCTPAGVMRMLKYAGIKLEGLHAVVLGRSNIVGKPMAQLLLRENCTVTVCHSRTKNLPEITRQGDILVAAIGKKWFVTPDMVKPGAVVVDVGINRSTKPGSKRIFGDVAREAAEVASYMTPVPGGVGPMTIVMLMEATVTAAERLVK